MTCVYSHAAPNPTNRTHSSHDCTVGRGSTAAWYRSKAKAAATDTASCDSSIQLIRMAGA